MPEFVNYSKSGGRLAEFITEQIPQSFITGNNGESVDDILARIPLPRWTWYVTEEEIVNDYIPLCLQKYFYDFLTYFEDPVFIRFSLEFPLPHPPITEHLNQDPPDPLHLPNGLLCPKVLANIACQFIGPDHILLTKCYRLELIKLACIMVVYGADCLSCHSLDTGLFRRAFQVKTLLASNAPMSSFPSKAQTELTSPDLDDRIQLLKDQGKICEIRGSPYLAQLASVPKSYKAPKVISTEKSDPVLKYLASLPKQSQEQLNGKNSEIYKEQQQLLRLLNMSEQFQCPCNQKMVKPCAPTDGRARLCVREYWGHVAPQRRRLLAVPGSKE